MITLINPNLVLQQSDMYTTGVVYMPIGLASFAGVLRASGIECEVIDSFGEYPNQHWTNDDYMFRGLTLSELIEKINSETKVIVIYAINLTYHRSIINIIQGVNSCFTDVPIVVMENTQAVTAYSLQTVMDELLDVGADYIITGESEVRGLELINALSNNSDVSCIDGVGFRKEGESHYSLPERKIENLDGLPFPAWDLFPIENYWKIKYAHGPFETKRYLPILTSRGCPYGCRFCIIPITNKKKWRARSAKDVVDEMDEHVQKFNVREFHIEDVNPTANDKRTREICEEILARGLNVIWKISAGTKVETMRDKSTIELMAKAGCKYISISPETGSPRVLGLINKPFKYGHAVGLVKKMNEVGIHSQACFVLGFPGENSDDREMTLKMVHDLTKVGIDEIAIFIITPVPGSDIYDEFDGFSDYSQLNFSPSWRNDYEELNRFRVAMYKKFMFWKMLYYPQKIVKQSYNFFIRKFETKMEMTPYRALHTSLMKYDLLGNRCNNGNELSDKYN